MSRGDRQVADRVDVQPEYVGRCSSNAPCMNANHISKQDKIGNIENRVILTDLKDE